MREWTPDRNPYAAPTGHRRKSIEAMIVATAAMLTWWLYYVKANLGCSGLALGFFFMLGLMGGGLWWIYG